MIFKNKYDRENLIFHESPTGSRFRVKRGWVIEDGEYKFTEKGVTNVYEKIQAEKDSVDLHAILKRYEDGDKTALDKVQGMYMDIVDMPKSYGELFEQVSRATDVFNAMPTEIKQKYNNSPATFWKNYGSEDFDTFINEFRSETLNRYGLEDMQPFNTSGTVEMPEKMDTPVSAPGEITDPKPESEVN